MIISRRWLCRSVIRRRLIRLRPIVRLRLIRFWTIRLRTIVRLRCRRTFVPHRRLCRAIIRRGLIRLWTIIRRRLIRLWTVVGLRCSWTIIPLRRLGRTIVRCRLIRLRTIRLSGIRTGAFIRRRRIERAVHGPTCRVAAGRGYSSRSRLSRRGLSYRRTCSNCGSTVRWLQTLHFLPRDRLPRMCRQHLLPGREGHGRRRRLRLRHNGTTSHCRWGSFHSVCHIGMNSEHAAGGGCDCSSRIHLSGGNFSFIDRDRRSRNWLRAGKSSLRNSYYCTPNILVHVRHIVDSRIVVDDCGVIDIGDRRSVHGGVADVDAVDVTSTHSIGRHVHFPRA